MRIAMVTPAYPLKNSKLDAGGVAGVSYYLAQELHLVSDIDLHVLVVNPEVNRNSLIELDGVTVHTISSLHSQAKRLAPPKERRRLVRAKIQEINCDIVHFQGTADLADLGPWPSVLTIHGISERDSFFRHNWKTRYIRYLILRVIYGRLRRRAKNIIAINPYVLQFLNPSRQSVWEIANPVARSYFQVSPDLRRKQFLYLGRIIPRKGIHRLLVAFDIVARDNPDVQLALAGDGLDSSYGQKCISQAQRLPCASRIRFHNSLTVIGVQEVMRQSSCLVLASSQESAPLVISEAMAAGLPVVAPDVGGIRWMLDGVPIGFLAKANSEDSLAQGMRQVLALNEHDLISGSLVSRSIARQKYDASAIARQTIEVYRHILNMR